VNTLEIKIADSRDDVDGDYRAVLLCVDGRNLVEILREIEKPFAEGEGHPGIAGSYAGLDAKHVTGDHLLGRPTVYSLCGRDGKKTPLLDCTCGCEGCWTFAARIEVSGRAVTWSDFEQVHRNGELSDEVWCYDAIGILQFDKKQYLAEIRKLTARPLNGSAAAAPSEGEGREQ
jgi:hypothetical protein